MNDAPKSLSGEIPDVSAAVDEVVAMALEKDPGKRLLPGELAEKFREAAGPDPREEKKGGGDPSMDTMVLTDIPLDEGSQ